MQQRNQGRNMTGFVVIFANFEKGEIIRVRSKNRILLTNSMLKITNSRCIVNIDGTRHERRLSVLDSIKTSNHRRIPPLKIFGAMLIFLDLAAVRLNTRLSFRLGIFITNSSLKILNDWTVSLPQRLATHKN
nr:MAG TPA: hypothetical protein [Microviridae sp.]